MKLFLKNLLLPIGSSWDTVCMTGLQYRAYTPFIISQYRSITSWIRCLAPRGTMTHNSNDKSTDGDVAPMTYAKPKLPATNNVRIYETINIDTHRAVVILARSYQAPCNKWTQTRGKEEGKQCIDVDILQMNFYYAACLTDLIRRENRVRIFLAIE